MKEESATSKFDVETIKRGVDIHVHFREPGLMQKETLLTGSVTAYLGGIGTVVEMPNTIPPVDHPDYFLEKQRRIETRLIELSDLGLNFKIFQAAALTRKNTTDFKVLNQLLEVAKIFKVFMANSTGNLGIDRDYLMKGLSYIRDETNKRPLIIFHAEIPDLISQTTSWKSHHRSRPAEAEVQAIHLILEIKEEFDLPFHITHVSTYEGAEQLSTQSKVSWDVLPKHLEFSWKDLKDLKNRGVMNPPIRTEKERKKLYNLFIDEKIPMLSSDHAPHTLEEKRNPISGAPGVQELMPFVIDKWLSGEISKSYLEQITFQRPKKILNMVGLDVVGDDLVVATELEVKVDTKWVRSKCGWSLWNGRSFKGKIINSYPYGLETIYLEEINQKTGA